MLKKRISILFIFLLFQIGINAQQVGAAAQHDSIPEPDRMAEDFVTASLLIVDQGYFIFSTLGHLSLRLQCPYYALDYVFSYEGERIDNRILAFLNGNLRMSVCAIPTHEYVSDCRKYHSGLTEYKLCLTPEQKLRLWEMMDNEMLKNQNKKYDTLKYGCTSTIRTWVTAALYPDSISYKYPLITHNSTIGDIFLRNTESDWWQFIITTIFGGRELFSTDISEVDLLFCPRELVKTWQVATINGVPLLNSKGERLAEYIPLKKTWFSPIIAAIILIFLSIIGLFRKSTFFDLVVFGWQALIGFLILLAMIFHPMSIMGWTWLFIAFNPLPLILFKWRDKWGLFYSVILLIYVIFIAFYPHRIGTTAHTLMTIAFIITTIKPIIQKTIKDNLTIIDNKKYV